MAFVPALKANRGKARVNNMVWPDTIRKKVVKTWLQTGNLTITAQLCKVPLDTVENWRYRQAWWKEYVQKFREEADAGMATRIEKLLGKTVEELEDRINNGDEVFDQRTGESTRVKVKVRDLNTTMKVLTDRHDVLIDRAKQETQATELINDKLTKLASAFERFANKGKLTHLEGDIIDAEYIDIPKEDSEASSPVECGLSTVETDERGQT